MSNLDVKVGDVVAVTAVDWGIYDGQVQRGNKFSIVYATLYGEVVELLEDGIVLAPQVFNDGGLRSVLTVPTVCISSVRVLQ